MQPENLSSEQMEKLLKMQERADAELQVYLKSKQQEDFSPLEAELYIPYTDTLEFRQEIEKIALLEHSLQEIRKIQESEREARIKSEKNATQETVRRNHSERLNGIISLISAIAAVVGAVFSVLAFFF